MSLSNEQLLEVVAHQTDLGHAKRKNCFLRQLRLTMKSPGTFLPQAAGKGASAMADLMSMYRFVGNDQIPIEKLRQIRAQTVLELYPQDAPVVVVHDMSTLDFSTQNAKIDRRLIGDHRGKGYEYVACVAVEPQSGALVGVLHDTVINAQGPDDTPMMDYAYEPLFEDFDEEEKQNLKANHRHQMAVHVNGLAPLLKDRQVIHLADREFDDIFIMERCLQNRADFVIRSMANRTVQVPRSAWIPSAAVTAPVASHLLLPGWTCVHLSLLIGFIPLQTYKDLPLDKRGRVTEVAQAARIAHLSIGACPVRLYRKARRNNRNFKPPRAIQLNLVVIREIDPPPGVAPLCWVLFTSLPIETQEQLFYIGRLYELRWKVETFFRLLKSGYHIEKQRFFDALKTAKHLVLISLTAMVLLHLKDTLNLPAGGKLDVDSHRKLKQATRELDNPDIDFSWRLFALIAKYGGWLGRRNDTLGPTIQMRGLLQVLSVLDAVRNHRALIEEALRNPDAVRRLLCV